MHATRPRRNGFGVWPYYSNECKSDVNQLLKKGGSLSAYRANPKFGLGPAKGSWTWRLEHEIEKRFSVRHAIAVNSGTAALHAALVALDVRGKEVITSPYTFSATVSAILLAGGIPVFVDVDPITFCITEEMIKNAITKKTKAIIPVNLFGFRPDYNELHRLGLTVIIDGCQSVGAIRDGEIFQRGCVAEVYSFNGGKNVPAGEAGMLVTNNDGLAEKARLLGNHAENFGTSWVGYNYRLNELTACIAYHGFLALEERNKKRIDLSENLYGALASERTPQGVWITNYIRHYLYTNGSHVYYVWPFTLSKTNRTLFAESMKRHGIYVGQGYITPPLHYYKAFRRYAKHELPVVDELSFRTLCLLDCVRPPATVKDMRYVAAAMKQSIVK